MDYCMQKNSWQEILINWNTTGSQGLPQRAIHLWGGELKRQSKSTLFILSLSLQTTPVLILFAGHTCRGSEETAKPFQRATKCLAERIAGDMATIYHRIIQPVGFTQPLFRSRGSLPGSRRPWASRSLWPGRAHSKAAPRSSAKYPGLQTAQSFNWMKRRSTPWWMLQSSSLTKTTWRQQHLMSENHQDILPCPSLFFTSV